MKLVIQRVSKARVTVNDTVRGAISKGLIVLLGVKQGDAATAAYKLAQKLLSLRIMADENGKMNRSILDMQGEILVVSQFTLYAETAGRRPGFTDAAPPDEARTIYEHFVATLRKSGLAIATGEFGAYMHVELTGDGPVTIIMEA